MKKSGLTIEEIRALHQAGRLAEAKEGYLALLKANPNDVSLIDLVGMLLAELGEFDEAQKYIEHALDFCPNNPVFNLHLANILKAKGLLDDATLVLLNVTKHHPHFAPAFNNLGGIYFAQEKWNEAIACYQAAIDIQPNYLDAYYNLGLTLSKQKLNKDAMEVYQSLLLLDPKHSASRFQLACLYMQAQQYKEAISHFLYILKEHPFHVESEVNLASCLLKLGQVDEAKLHYEQALVMMPNDTQILFNLGVINMQQERIHDAIEYYLRLEKLNPNFSPVQQNLGAAFLVIKERDQALQHFRKALQLEPQNQSIAHLVHVLSQDKTLSFSPPEYIKTLFDSYADHYDAHLMGSLHYQVPQYFYDAVKSFYPTFLETHLDILDLGCGTGLCGELFKPQAKRLTGVDLSKKMLEMAAQKKIYDELIEDDVVTFLQAKEIAYDLILAGDVLVYFGDLSLMFTAIAKALRDKGLFVFNTEISTVKDYELKESGRFAHHSAYISQLAKEHRLAVLQCEKMSLRKDQQDEISGYLFVLQKEGVTEHT